MDERPAARRTRRAAALVAVAALALASALPARAADDPAAKLRDGWAKATDAQRDALLAAFVAAPSPDAFVVAKDTAKSALDVLAEAKADKRKIDAWLAEQDAAGAAADPGADPKAPAPKGKSKAADPFAQDRAEARNLAWQVVRETAALSRLAVAAGAVLDALSDADFAKSAGGALREAAKDDHAGWPAFAADAVGAAKKDRTSTFLLDLAAEALKDQRKATSDRAAPAKKLDDVNHKLADLVDGYLKTRYAQGDYSGQVPVGLMGQLPAQKDALDKEVTRIQRLIEGADQERRAAGKALSRWLAASAEPSSTKGMDLVEHRLVAGSDLDDRALGLLVLGSVPGARAFGLVKAAAADADPRVVVEALTALSERDEPEAIAMLAGRLADERWRVRASAAEALGKTGRAAAAKPLVEALVGAKGRDLDDLRTALVALTGRSFPAAPGPWAAWLDGDGKDFRGKKDEKPAGAAPGKGSPAAGPALPDEGGVEFYGITTHSTRVLLVLDVSGSMNFPGSEKDKAKKKIDVLREEVKKTLTGLPDGATFDVITFATSVTTWRKDPQVRGSKTLADAVEWFEKVPALGSTNIHDALEQAFKLMGQGLAKDKSSEPVYDTVFLMTDGKPSSGKVTDPKLILGEVRRWNEARKVRLHVVGVGGHGKALGGQAADDIDVEFLKDLALQNGGQCVIR